MKFLLLFVFTCALTEMVIAQKTSDTWYRIESEDLEQQGYANAQGEIMITIGKYPFCYTDTFNTYAIVLVPGNGFMAINKREVLLYKVFPFDNGPDYAAEGLFRMVKDEKIGFADEKTGEIVIQPQFDFAEPFHYGASKVCDSCDIQKMDEHSLILWENSKTYFIDKKGKKIETLHDKVYDKSAVDKHVAELKSLMKHEKLIPKKYQNKSYYGGALTGYYQGTKLQIIESNNAGEFSNINTLIYLKDSSIIKVEITKQLPDFESYKKKYPEHQEINPKLLTFYKQNTTITPGTKMKIAQSGTLPDSTPYTGADYKKTRFEVECMMVELRSIPYVEEEIKKD